MPKKHPLPALIALGCAAWLQAQVSMSVSPLTLELKISPGKSKSAEICLANDAFTPTRVTGSVEDWLLERDGSLSPGGNVSHESSCRTWIRMNAAEFDIAPGEKRYISLKISVPRGTPPGHYWAAVAFRSGAPQPAGTEGHGVRLREKLISGVFIRVGRFKLSGRIQDADVTASEGRTGIRLSIENTGSGYFYTSGNLEIRADSGEVLKTELPQEIVLPRSARDIAWFADTSLPPGIYALVCRLRLPDGKSVSFRKNVDIGGKR